MIINVSVKDKVAQVTGAPVIVCGNSDYRVVFTLDDEWEDLEGLTARFSWYKDGAKQFTDVPVMGSTVEVPILADITEVFVGLFAGELHTTTPARITCQRSILCGDGVKVLKGDKGDPGRTFKPLMYGLPLTKMPTVQPQNGFVYQSFEKSVANGDLYVGAQFLALWYGSDDSNMYLVCFEVTDIKTRDDTTFAGKVIGSLGALDGKGITSIAKTSTSGLVDTYNITFTDNSKTTFTVTNGNGIASIAKTDTSGLVDTYNITFTDNSKTAFTVTNGNGIYSIAKTGTSGLVDTYTITLEDGRTATFTVTNGEKGATGATGAKVVSTELQGQDANGGNIYKQTFDNGTTATFTAPKGATGTTGAAGADGNGVESIEKTGTSGLVDTYTITFTNGQTTTFNVTNGETGPKGDTGLTWTGSIHVIHSIPQVGEEYEYGSSELGDKTSDFNRYPVVGEVYTKYYDYEGAQGNNATYMVVQEIIGIDSTTEGITARVNYVHVLDGAVPLNTKFIGTDENGGNVYEIEFSNGTFATITAPKGEGSSIGLFNGKAIDRYIFNKRVSVKQLEAYFSKLTYENGVSLLVDTIAGIGVYAIRMSDIDASGSGYAIAVVTVDENGGTTINEIVFMSQYTDENKVIAQNALGDETFTFSKAGWIGNGYYVLPSQTQVDGSVDVEVNSFVSSDDSFWDMVYDLTDNIDVPKEYYFFSEINKNADEMYTWENLFFDFERIENQHLMSAKKGAKIRASSMYGTPKGSLMPVYKSLLPSGANGVGGLLTADFIPGPQDSVYALSSHLSYTEVKDYSYGGTSDKFSKRKAAILDGYMYITDESEQNVYDSSVKKINFSTGEESSITVFNEQSVRWEYVVQWLDNEVNTDGTRSPKSLVFIGKDTNNKLCVSIFDGAQYYNYVTSYSYSITDLIFTSLRSTRTFALYDGNGTILFFGYEGLISATGLYDKDFTGVTSLGNPSDASHDIEFIAKIDTKIYRIYFTFSNGYTCHSDEMTVSGGITNASDVRFVDEYVIEATSTHDILYRYTTSGNTLIGNEYYEWTQDIRIHDVVQTRIITNNTLGEELYETPIISTTYKGEKVLFFGQVIKYIGDPTTNHYESKTTLDFGLLVSDRTSVVYWNKTDNVLLSGWKVRNWIGSCPQRFGTQSTRGKYNWMYDVVWKETTAE